MATGVRVGSEYVIDSTVESSNPDEHLDPLLARYYAKARAVQSLRGRLEELERARSFELREREFRRDQEDESLVSDEEFEKSFENQRDDIENRLKDANLELLQLRELCHANGLDTETAKWRHHHSVRLGDPCQPQNAQIQRSQRGSFSTYENHNNLDSLPRIKYCVQYSPSEEITQPELRDAYGVKSRLRLSLIFSTRGIHHDEYALQEPAKKFFVIGKVFEILWPASISDTGQNRDQLRQKFEVSYETSEYQVQRFIVIGEAESYCSALVVFTENQFSSENKPIESKSADFQAYAQLVDVESHKDDLDPDSFTRRPIRIEVAEHGHEMTLGAYVNFRGVYTIDHSIDAKSVGRLSPGCHRKFRHLFRDAWKKVRTSLNKEALEDSGFPHVDGLSRGMHVSSGFDKRQSNWSQQHDYQDKDNAKHTSRNFSPSSTASDDRFDGVKTTLRGAIDDPNVSSITGDSVSSLNSQNDFSREAMGYILPKYTMHKRTGATPSEDTLYLANSKARINAGGRPHEERETKQYKALKRRLKPKEFFTLGRVFIALWTESIGELESSTGSSIATMTSGISTGYFGERILSKIRKFVVVREGVDSCTVLPITTYGGLGVARKGVLKAEHTIIHTGKTSPAPHPDELPSRGETGLLPRSIRVDAVNKTEKLDPMSRLDFGKASTIQHNVRVRSVGTVYRGSLEPLLNQWRSVLGNASGARSSQEQQRSLYPFQTFRSPIRISSNSLPNAGQDAIRSKSNFSRTSTLLETLDWSANQSEIAVSDDDPTEKGEIPTIRMPEPSGDSPDDRSIKPVHVQTQLETTYCKQPMVWFQQYRVFMTVWHDSAGDDDPSKFTSSLGYTREGQYGDWIHSKIRWFVVVGTATSHSLCLPILTYNREGTAISGVNPQYHAIIYAGSEPEPTPDERKLGTMRTPIEVQLDDSRSIFDPISRLSYERVYTIEHNRKVKAVGWIHPRCRQAFDAGRAIMFLSIGATVRTDPSSKEQEEIAESYYEEMLTSVSDKDVMTVDESDGESSSDSYYVIQ